MPTTSQDPESTRLSLIVEEAMTKRGVSIRDLAEKLDITYEHIRRVVRGECVPSRFVLKAICEELGLNFKETDILATADKIRKKFGGIPLELSGKKPGMEQIELVWDGLTADQQRDLTGMARAWYSRNNITR